MPYVNRTVKHPSSLYELGIFTQKYVNRTVQETIYCTFCVLPSHARKKAGIRSESRPPENVYYFNDSGDSNPSSPQKKLMHLSAASKSPMLSILMTTLSFMNVPTATQPLADS